MLLSMTGFGDAHFQGDALALGIELRAVNNRYLKITLRASDPYHLLEPEFEKVIRRVVRRGTLQVHLRCEREAGPGDFRLNKVALTNYLTQVDAAIQELQLGERGNLLLSQVLMLPGVVAEPSSRTQRLHDDWPTIEQVLTQALDRLQQMRRDEGQAMATELLQYRDTIRIHLEQIRTRIPKVGIAYRDRLFERVQNFLNEHDLKLDRSELIKEVSIFTERSDIAEEVTRLNSHLDQFQEIMKEPESPGRKLDFLIQEMFREINTIGSKANDVEISRHVVEIKGSLEKIRELVQNVE